MEVTYIDHMGSDSRIVDAARVSFSKLSENYSDTQNERLIKYLATHGHFTPFTHCVITVKERVPIFVARQRFKHQIGFSYNEESRRYIDSTPEFYVPDVWRKRADNKKQGSSDEEIEELFVDRYYEGNFGDLEGQEWSYKDILGLISEWYSLQVEQGNMAPEQARMVLPQSMYTEYICTGSLAAFARAYKLRSEEHSQKEIRDLAEQWDGIMKDIAPLSWEALTA